MKLTITKEDVRQAILQYSGIDIENNVIDIELEGYVKVKDLRPKAELPKVTENIGDVVTDKNLNVIAIKPEKSEPDFAGNFKKEIPKRKGKARNEYIGRVHYEEYKNEVLDFATSSERQREVASFGLTLPCNKERYKKAIQLAGVTDMVRFGQIDSKPYLIRIGE